MKPYFQCRCHTAKQNAQKTPQPCNPRLVPHSLCCCLIPALPLPLSDVGDVN